MERFNPFIDMAVVEAGTKGWCGGVWMASKETTWLLNEVNQRCSLDNRPRVLANHLPVHNIPEVARLKALGLEVFDNDWSKVSPRSAVVLSAHGSPANYPEIAEELECFVLDVTCPLVIGNQRKVIKAMERDDYVIVIGAKKGDKVHPEADSYLDRTAGQGQLIQTAEDLNGIIIPDNKDISIVTQTTMAVRGMEPIFNELTERYGKRVKLPLVKTKQGDLRGDICGATDFRQQAVFELIRMGVDGLVVVGSDSSHNSLELARIAQDAERPALLRDQAKDLDEAWFADKRYIGLTAGASANDEEIKEFITWFKDRGVTKFSETGKIEPKEILQFPLPHAGQVQTKFDAFLAKYYAA